MLILFVMMPIRNDVNLNGLIKLASKNGDNRLQQLFITKISLCGLVRKNVNVEASQIPMNNVSTSLAIKARDHCPNSSHFQGKQWIKRMMESSVADSEKDFVEDDFLEVPPDQYDDDVDDTQFEKSPSFYVQCRVDGYIHFEENVQSDLGGSSNGV